MITSKEETLAAKEAAEAAGGYFDWDETPFVECDEPCFSLREPKTLEEYRDALEHWKNHRHLSGCSHGC